MHKIVLIGSGNAATVLGRLMKKQGHEIVQVVSRNLENARILANELGAYSEPLTAPSFAEADIYIISVLDQAIKSMEKYEALRGKFVVHTAGSVSINALANISDRYGVLYPLQTLSKFVDHIPEIPFMVDGNNADTIDTLIKFARTISSNVSYANDNQRMGYHIAAVFATNFSNHMFALAEIYCQRENIDFKMMHPLIEEICTKVKMYSPYLTQTGPAIRNDSFTMGKHLEMLSRYPELKYMYIKLTENIIKIHGKR